MGLLEPNFLNYHTTECHSHVIKGPLATAGCENCHTAEESTDPPVCDASAPTLSSPLTPNPSSASGLEETTTFSEFLFLSTAERQWSDPLRVVERIM